MDRKTDLESNTRYAPEELSRHLGKGWEITHSNSGFMVKPEKKSGEIAMCRYILGDSSSNDLCDVSGLGLVLRGNPEKLKQSLIEDLGFVDITNYEVIGTDAQMIYHAETLPEIVKKLGELGEFNSTYFGDPRNN